MADPWLLADSSALPLPHADGTSGSRSARPTRSERVGDVLERRRELASQRSDRRDNRERDERHNQPVLHGGGATVVTAHRLGQEVLHGHEKLEHWLPLRSRRAGTPGAGRMYRFAIPPTPAPT